MRLLTFLCALALLTAPALAAKPRAAAPPVAAGETCIAPVDKILAQLRGTVEANPQFELQLFEGERAKKLIAAVNAMPPESSFGGDRVVAIIDAKNEKPRFMMFFVTGGCITHAFPAAPLAMWQGFLKSALGVES